MATRDEFSAETRRRIAGRAGYRCSDPECQRFTLGPTIDPAGLFNVGVAAHITAAAEGGPRYDEKLTREQRRHPSNGIWMCQTHGKQVDDDADKYPKDLLMAWKKDAEERTLVELDRGPATEGAAGVAQLSRARRIGIDARAVLEDGNEIAFARLFDPKNDMLAVLGLPTWCVRFLLAKTNVPRIVLYELRAVVYAYAPVPTYRPLMYAYPLTVFPYIIDLVPPDANPRTCPALTYVPFGEKNPVDFTPLMIDDDIPVGVDARFNVAQPGLYTFALDTVVMADVKPQTFRVLDHTTVLFV